MFNIIKKKYTKFDKKTPSMEKKKKDVPKKNIKPKIVRKSQGNSKKPRETSFIKFKKVIELIEKQGLPLTKALKEVKLDHKPFYSIVDLSDENRLLYARACEKRAEVIFEEILEIADEKCDDVIYNEDGTISENREFINRSRLRIDARKWMLGKMQPKKYGDKLDLTTDGEKLPASTPTITFKKFEE